MTDGPDYRVALDIYRGPLDLLLYLIRENEVEITDIPIAKITDQFIHHLELIRMIDPNAAGDFLVMASTLMEIKSRTLLPRPETDEEEEDVDDPRFELIRQLMEYKRFKEAASQLAEKEQEQALRFPRGLKQSFRRLEGDDEGRELEDVSIWDILTAFDKVMRETLRFQPATIVDRDIPLRRHIESILRMLRVQQMVTFLNIFEACEDRIEAVGAFLAILEMARRCILSVEQTGERGEVYVRLIDEGPVAKLLEEVSEDVDLSAKETPEGEDQSADGATAEETPDPVAPPNENAIDAPSPPGPRTPPSVDVAMPVDADGERISLDIRLDEEDEEIDGELKAIRDIRIRDVDLGKELAPREEHASPEEQSTPEQKPETEAPAQDASRTDDEP